MRGISVGHSHLFHPVSLADFLQFYIKRDPWTFHLGIDFTEPTFTDSPAWTVGHKFWTFGFG